MATITIPLRVINRFDPSLANAVAPRWMGPADRASSDLPILSDALKGRDGAALQAIGEYQDSVNAARSLVWVGRGVAAAVAIAVPVIAALEGTSGDKLLALCAGMSMLGLIGSLAFGRFTTFGTNQVFRETALKLGNIDKQRVADAKRAAHVPSLWGCA